MGWGHLLGEPSLFGTLSGFNGYQTDIDNKCFLKTIVGGSVDLLGFVGLPSVLPIQPLTPLVGRGCRQGPPGPDPGGGKAPPDRHRAHSHTLAGFFLSSIFFCFFFSYFFIFSFLFLFYS